MLNVCNLFTDILYVIVSLKTKLFLFINIILYSIMLCFTIVNVKMCFNCTRIC